MSSLTCFSMMFLNMTSYACMMNERRLTTGPVGIEPKTGTTSPGSPPSRHVGAV